MRKKSLQLLLLLMGTAEKEGPAKMTQKLVDMIGIRWF